MSVRTAISDRLPSEGTMGALQRRTPALYWLSIVVGLAAYAGAIIAAVGGVALLAVTLARTAITVAVGAPWPALQWFALAVAVAAFEVGVVVAAMRWVGGVASNSE